MPTYTEDHLLLRFGGPAAQAQEEWSCGVRLAFNVPPAPAAQLELAQDALATMVTACSNYVQSGSAGFNSLCSLGYVKLNPINASTGKYRFPNSPVEQLLEAPLPTGPAPSGPLQVAYVVTLRGTDFRRGPAAFGRWYVPVGAPTTTNTGVFGAASAQQYADRAGSFLEEIQYISSDPGLVLRAQLFGDGIGGPRQSDVRSVEVGNVYDTQRRRRASIEETYYPATTWIIP